MKKVTFERKGDRLTEYHNGHMFMFWTKDGIEQGSIEYLRMQTDPVVKEFLKEVIK
jgi:hypothetical protein